MDKNKYNDQQIDDAIRVIREHKDALRKNEPKKETRKVPIHDGKIFKDNEIDSSVMIENARKLKEAEMAAASYPVKTELERRQEKRKLEIKKQILLEKKRQDCIKHFKKIIATILIGSTTITGAAYAATKMVPKIEDSIKISDAKDKLTDLGEENLVQCGLGTKEDGEFKIGNNSVSDYSVLDADTPMEVYIYKLAMDDTEEFNKFIRSVSYNDGTYNYESYEQFLRINGYYDQTSNKVSEYVFNNIMEGTLLTAYDKGTISSYENEFYTSDIDSQNKTR